MFSRRSSSSVRSCSSGLQVDTSYERSKVLRRTRGFHKCHSMRLLLYVVLIVDVGVLTALFGDYYKKENQSQATPRITRRMDARPMHFPKTVVLGDSERVVSFLDKRGISDQVAPSSTSKKHLLEVEIKKITNNGSRSRTSCPSVSLESGEKKQCTAKRIFDVAPLISCNDVHSIDLALSVGALNDVESSTERFTLKYLDMGGTRTVWWLQDRQHEEKFALKVLRYNLQFTLADSRVQQLDAIAMERLTSSPYSLNIFGFCGQSSIVEHVSRTAHSLLSPEPSPLEKLRYAADMAHGMADLHGISASGEIAIVHNDVTSSNFLATINDRIKLSDFNAGHLQCWHDDQMCGYKSREEFGGTQRRVDVRAPEELQKGAVLSEKSDVYGLGTAFYYVLTSKRPYSGLSDDEKRERILSGTLPELPPDIRQSGNVAITAIKESMLNALQFDAKKRPSARTIANALDEALSSLRTQSTVFLAGLVSNIEAISSSRLDQLVELNCLHNVGIHILAGEVPTKWTVEERREKYQRCAPFVVIRENANIVSLFPNRIDRLAYLRDVQRTSLRQYYDALENDVVVNVDLDLYEIPSNEELVEEISSVIHNKESPDVVCAAGQMFHPYGYYDMFSTVLSPQTFVYPLAGRLVEKYMPGEDPALVRSNDAYGSFTQWDLMDYLEDRAADSPEGTVLVRSCFGGLSIYRATKWFLPDCKYGLDTQHLMDYANKEDGRPCEHLVFHDCLLHKDLSTKIAVKPSLKTTWDKPAAEKNELAMIGDSIDNGLVTFAKAPDNGMRLANGSYQLRIDHQGSLVVEQVDGSSVNETWTAEVDSSLLHTEWDIMFLQLKESGELVLIQQVTRLRPTLNPELCQVVDEKENKRSCRIVVWTNGFAEDSGTKVLSLTTTGEIQVKDKDSGRLVWSNRGRTDADGDHEDVDSSGNVQYVTPKSDCLASGDEHTINAALNRVGAEAVLCQGSEFRLNAPIRFTHDHQKLYTAGHATGKQRALLKVSHPSVATAISMVGVSNVTLRDVIVDGNRQELAHVQAEHGGGLIDAGGASVSSQLISNIRALDPRSWSCLHVIEGSIESECRGVVVEHSEFGPAGYNDGLHNEWADGISYACTNGLVQNNTIIDATDGGIVVFGAPGTVVQDNVIVAKTRRLFGGINMVDYNPYKGNFTRTIVRRNEIVADGAMIHVGLGMGSCVWHCCQHDSDYLFGALVANNTLRGQHMGYGFAVNGVNSWTTMHNVDLSEHTKEKPTSPSCKDSHEIIPSPPRGFQIDASTSHGFFQDDFRNAAIRGIVNCFRTNISSESINSDEASSRNNDQPNVVWSNETLLKSYPLSIQDQTVVS